MICYELKAAVGQNCPKNVEMSENEQKMNRSQRYYGKSLEWQWKEKQFKKNDIYYATKEATIRLNVWSQHQGHPVHYS